MAAPALSVVIPAYNEAGCIAATVAAVRDGLDPLVPSWELLIVDDGSTDGTADIARTAAGGDSRIRVVEAPHAGKGAAVRRGMLEATGDWRFLADADLSTPIAEIVRFMPGLGPKAPESTSPKAPESTSPKAPESTSPKAPESKSPPAPESTAPVADVVIGSREMAGAQRINEPWLRHSIGRVFTAFVKLMVLRGIEDTQCGFKLFRGSAAERLFRQQRLDGFGFDVEVLYLARRAGLRIEQVPVTWTYDPNSKVTWRSGIDGFVDVLRIRRMYARGGGIWPAATWAVAAIMAAAVSLSVLAIPIQTTDSIVPILQAEATPSVRAAFVDSMYSAAFLRPLRIAQIQLLFEWAQQSGRWFLLFRGFHVALVLAAFALFVTALKVRTSVDFLVAALAMTVLTGVHTFLGTVWEAYPINHFLEIVVFCLLALVLAQSRGGWWVDLLAGLTFVVASMTLESGLLVWVVIVAARFAGLKGVSRRGVVGVTLLLGGYMYLRFGVIATGTPTLVERASGFWTERYEPDELIRRFGERPYLFYLYNVLSSAASVLFSEPRAGVFAMPRQLIAGELMPGTLMNVFSSAVVTLLMLRLAYRRRLAWWRMQFQHSDQLVIVALAVLAGNAAISYGYTKDETMSVAGAFYGLAAFAAVREAINGAALRGPIVRALFALVLALTATAWTVRTVGLHYHMSRIAHIARGEWVTVERWLQEQEAGPANDRQRRIVETLRDQAIDRPALNRYFLPRWGERWFQ